MKNIELKHLLFFWSVVIIIWLLMAGVRAETGMTAKVEKSDYYKCVEVCNTQNLPIVSPSGKF